MGLSQPPESAYQSDKFLVRSMLVTQLLCHLHTDSTTECMSLKTLSNEPEDEQRTMPGSKLLLRFTHEI
jgi:hypothetical protein